MDSSLSFFTIFLIWIQKLLIVLAVALVVPIGIFYAFQLFEQNEEKKETVLNTNKVKPKKTNDNVSLKVMKDMVERSAVTEKEVKYQTEPIRSNKSKNSDMTLYNADVYYYCRSIEHDLSSGNLITKKNFWKNGPKFIKHWGLVIKFVDYDDDEGFPASFIYHANCVDGKLKAIVENFTGKFLKFTGAKEILLLSMPVSKCGADSFVEVFNKRNLDYSLTNMNCQNFTEELAINLGICSDFYLPTTAKEIKKKGIFGSLSSVSNISSCGLGWLIVRETIFGLTGDVGKKLFQEAFEWGITKCSLLNCSGIKQMMKETGQQVVLTTSGEILENTMCFARGAFSPLQLLQIPVEIITNWLIKKHFFKDSSEKDREAYAYALSKVASLSTAACVGLIAGPMGMAGAVAFWFAAEIVSYIIRKCLEQTGDWFVKRFGESKNDRLLSILMNSMLPRMIDYLNKFVAKKHLE